MDLVKIYQCFCDVTRLRILNLLQAGELCVCHFQEILGEPQVKISKHLAYLRSRGLVNSRKEANWMVYRLPEKPTPELAANLACLQECLAENAMFTRDTAKLSQRSKKFAANSPACCPPKKASRRMASTR